ncbi:MAG: DNA-directed RNA polymerase subunit alpha [Candidatus Vogelbacteria bacterium CG10_big_fil_rev_8_21_14_0_10_45_14]|uniref:DNA-directed RNA polymerase subunit alpha n=1 Tax=Candidatus Vogelbacteria bacterium CG10_big_fil_rev_8_21_14_0_10_45_14 TaxID=1975042 RepID=A0A2H0RKT9_9BACT|nr:MAG: DNA-directed RNA polymerase subunit alpha [Candidatus Vogelbacteria bacterium CG10_big_fil_rev_8_21_14_0_10_45_14]
MHAHTIILPSKPRIISETESKGIYEIENLYPGYGHTLGNSLRRVILSSLPGTAITTVKIEGVPHEFSTIKGVKEDVITILLNLKQLRFKLHGEESETISLSANSVGLVTAGDLTMPSQVEIMDKDQPIATITEKGVSLNMEIKIEHGIGFVPKDAHQHDKVPVGTIALDAVFAPIRRINYEVENMRVGNRTDYNKLRLSLETDGVISPREALEKAIMIIISQLKAIVGFKEEEPEHERVIDKDSVEGELESDDGDEQKTDVQTQEDSLKTRIDDVNFSTRTMKALSEASIRTLGGIARKREEDLLAIPGLGDKGIAEIRRALGNFGITLKQ